MWGGCFVVSFFSSFSLSLGSLADFLGFFLSFVLSFSSFDPLRKGKGGDWVRRVEIGREEEWEGEQGGVLEGDRKEEGGVL